MYSSEQDAAPAQGGHRARFYRDYRKVAAEYDKEFLKKNDEDLNTTLIFVSCSHRFHERILTRVQAGLFSAVASAFILQVDSQLQPSSGDETVALLRLLIHKIDNTTFGNNVPTIPQWNGPPSAIVQVQAILFASLTISLFSAFLAMLGKQWLNLYESAEMRGSAIERSHNRQRKLAGIFAWYFVRVMESLPLMMQAALLLLGVALSLYLWEININIASVVVGMTSLGLIFYLFIIIAGTASESCPYQTPFAHVFRRLIHHLRAHLLPALRSTATAVFVAVSSNLSRLYHTSWCCRWLLNWRLSLREPWYSMNNVLFTFLYIVLMPMAPAHDVYCFGRFIVQSLVVFGKKSYPRFTGSPGAAYRRFTNTSPRTHSPGQKTITMDLRCISWILQTSLDTGIQCSAFKHLTSIPQLAYFHPTLVVDCFNILIRCINVSNGKVAVAQGFGQLATVSAEGFSRTLHHLATMDPTSKFLADIQRQYNDVFPSEVDFSDLPFRLVMAKIHSLAGRFGDPRDIRWSGQRLPVQEHVPLVRNMVVTAQEKYEQTEHRKVPRWTLRSALYFLSLGPVSPASVVADCLTIIAIDLGCDVSGTTALDERYVQI